MGQLQDGKVILQHLERVELSQVEQKKLSLRKGDLLFNRTNSQALVGKVGLVNEDSDAVFASYLVRFRVKEDGASAEYINFIFNLPKIQKAVNRLITRGVSQCNINPTKLCKELHIQLPPLEEQLKLVGLIKSWNNTTDQLQSILETKREHKRALTQRLLTGKLRFPEFAGQPWPKLSADKIFKSHSKKGNANAPLLAVMQDVGVVPRDSLGRRVAMPEGDTHSYKLVEPGDFVISLRSFQGGLEYSRHQGIVSPAYTVLKSVCPIVDGFYKHYFKSYDFIGHLAVAVIGIRDGKQISYDDFSLLKLPYPGLDEQRKIAAVLSAADREIDQLTQKLDAYKQQKKGLMQQLLTGKKRVKLDHKEAA
jgi:type I restriction enzyme S subunit